MRPETIRTLREQLDRRARWLNSPNCAAEMPRLKGSIVVAAFEPAVMLELIATTRHLPAMASAHSQTVLSSLEGLAQTAAEHGVKSIAGALPLDAMFRMLAGAVVCDGLSPALWQGIGNAFASLADAVEAYAPRTAEALSLAGTDILEAIEAEAAARPG